jgi:hypothetical protein
MGNKETDEVRVTAPSSTYLQNYAELHPILPFWYSRLLIVLHSPVLSPKY